MQFKTLISAMTGLAKGSKMQNIVITSAYQDHDVQDVLFNYLAAELIAMFYGLSGPHYSCMPDKGASWGPENVALFSTAR